MGLFNKRKKEDIPKLPKLPDISPMPIQPILPDTHLEELHPNQQQNNFSLPTFPSSNLGNELNQNRIKEEITRGEFRISMPPPMPPINPTQPPEIEHRFPKQKRTGIDNPILPPIQIPEIRIKETRIPKTLEIAEWESSPEYQKQEIHQKIKKTEPLFIQLDKFEETISAFDEIKLKVSEIESLLSSIRTVKQKEEETLNHWENQIEQIKVQLDQIDKELFSKL